jgi:high-affinity iron transporter
MFGYQDAPTVSTLSVYLIYLIGALVLFFLPHPRAVSMPSKPAQHHQPSSVTNK